MKLSIILPCYNEEENIARIPPELVPELRALNCEYEIIIVDDGSTDRTYEAAKNLNIPEIKIARHAKNLGVGRAFKTGIENIDSDICAILDSDFTFHPKYIKPALERLGKGDVDFVGGSPKLAEYSKNIAPWRILVTKTSNLVYGFLFGHKVTCASGFFRVYKSKDLKELKLDTSGFDISVEILFKLLAKGKRYAEIPAPLTVRQFGESKLDYKKEILKHAKLLLKIINWRINK